MEHEFYKEVLKASLYINKNQPDYKKRAVEDIKKACKQIA